MHIARNTYVNIIKFLWVDAQCDKQPFQHVSCAGLFARKLTKLSWGYSNVFCHRHHLVRTNFFKLVVAIECIAVSIYPICDGIDRNFDRARPRLLARMIEHDILHRRIGDEQKALQG